MDFQTLMTTLYERMVSTGRKYDGDSKPQNIWWCVEKDRPGNRQRGFEAVMKALARKEGI